MFHIQFSSQKNHLFGMAMAVHPDTLSHGVRKISGVGSWQLKPQPATGTESQYQLHEKEKRKKDVEDLRQDPRSRIAMHSQHPVRSLRFV